MLPTTAEIDMVLPIGWLRSGDLTYVEADIRAVVDAVGGAPVKVILENAYLGDEEKVAECRAAEAADGVRPLDVLLEFAGVGVTRFGATVTAAILDDLAHRHQYGEPLAVVAPSSPTSQGQLAATHAPTSPMSRSAPSMPDHLISAPRPP